MPIIQMALPWPSQLLTSIANPNHKPLIFKTLIFSSPITSTIPHSSTRSLRSSSDLSFSLPQKNLRCCDTTASCSPPTRIFIKGLALSTSEGSLKSAFSEYGEVSKVKIMIDKRSRQSLGFAYVWFHTEDSAQLAVKAMNGKFFEGRFVFVTIAKPRPEITRVTRKAYKF